MSKYNFVVHGVIYASDGKRAKEYLKRIVDVQPGEGPCYVFVDESSPKIIIEDTGDPV